MIQNPTWPAATEKTVLIDGKPVKVLAYLEMSSEYSVSSNVTADGLTPPEKPDSVATKCPVCGMVRSDDGPSICTYGKYMCKYVSYPCGTMVAVTNKYVIWYKLSKECASSLDDVI